MFTAAILVATSGTASAGSCVQSSASIDDPYHNHFSQKWTCGTDSGAPVYSDATLSSVQTGTMYSGANTWLLCYRRGEVHSGGNDVWYYTEGDVANNGQNKWGYMPAAYVWENSDPWPGMPACSSSGPVGYADQAPLSGYSPPSAYDVPNNRTKVLLVHGYYIPDSAQQIWDARNGGWQYWGWNCNSYWGQELGALQNDGFRRENITTIGFYQGDSYCDASIINVNHATPTIGTIGTSIAHLANNLAWYIWDYYSAYGVNVNVITHSMGGLILHAAISGTQYRNYGPFNIYNWPPYLYVHDVATLGGPFQGSSQTYDGLACVAEAAVLSPDATEECREMTPYQSNFLNDWISGWDNPQARVLGHQNGVTTGGTDWTMIGSVSDTVVSPGSSLNIDSVVGTPPGDPYIGHKVLYKSANGLDHMDLVYRAWNSPSTYSAFYCDYNMSCDMSPASDVALVTNSDNSNWAQTGSFPSPEEVASKAVQFGSW